MKKLAKKLSIFIVLCTSLQIWGASISLMSTSPHTQDLYFYAPRQVNTQDQSHKCNLYTEKRGLSRSFRLAESLSEEKQNQHSLTYLQEVDEKTYLLYALAFLYSICVILVFIRTGKLFFLSKSR